MIFKEIDRRNFLYEYHDFVAAARRCRGGIVVLDTEFPGTIYHSHKPHYAQSLAERYALLKANADDLRPIQVGITLCGIEHPKRFPEGEAYDSYSITWQFNLCDFDVYYHPHAKDSITLLESAGICMVCTRNLGIPSVWLAQLLVDSGLIGSENYTWVLFQGGYDIAILLRAVLQLRVSPTRRAILPPTLEEFLTHTRWIFGSNLYDVKYLMKTCGLYGGLECLAEKLMLKRKVGKPHQAGSDSLLIGSVFFKIRQLYFSPDDQDKLYNLPCKGHLFGLSDS